MLECKHLVTVVNSISQTSMPVNEFVQYRQNKFSESMQTLIVFDNFDAEKQKMINPNISVLYVGSSGQRIRSTVKKIISEDLEKGVKTIFHLHQPKSGLLFRTRLLSLNRQLNIVFTIHSQYPAYNMQNKILSICCFLFSNRVVFVSESSYDAYPKWIKKSKRNKISIICNGFDSIAIDDRLSKPLEVKTEFKYNNVVLAYVARIIDLKNHVFLLDVVEKIPGVNVLLIGEVVNKSIIKEIEKRGLSERVILTGKVSRQSVFDLLRQSDLYVSTSLIEGMPVSVLEAMYVGLPVVLSSIRPHLEIMKKTSTNTVTTVDFEMNQWVDILNYYINNDELRYQQGLKCRFEAKSNFDLNRMLVEYDKIYDGL